MKRDRFLVESPERIQFWRESAESGARAASFFVDTILQGLIVVIVVLISGGLSAFAKGFSQAGTAFLIILLFLVQWGYGFFFEVLLSGRSPGKLLFRLRVVRLDGESLDLRSLALRNLLRAADGLPFMALPLLGGFVSMADPLSRRIGDLVAGTVVVKDARQVLAEPATDLGALAPYGSAAIVCTPGNSLGEEELYIIRRFLSSRGSMPPPRARATAELLAAKAAKRLGIEAPAAGADPVAFLEGVYRGQSS
ncbi:MAG TPA: RDD family protein [Spirochaetia bacterium]|nr:RDD family protein [Spirochaetia bacterium]HRZ65423.1 RDD family protein [Spirochaetia bacterium]